MQLLNYFTIEGQGFGLDIGNIGARYTGARIQINADPKWTCQVQIVSGFAYFFYSA